MCKRFDSFRLKIFFDFKMMVLEMYKTCEKLQQGKRFVAGGQRERDELFHLEKCEMSGRWPNGYIIPLW